MEESICFVKNLTSVLLMDLNVLGCPDHNLNFSGKYLFVCLFVCVCETKILWKE